MTPIPEQALQFGPYRIYPEQRLVLDVDQPLRLGSRALDILLVLLEQPGEVISRQHLISRVWPTSVVEDSNLRVHMAALRKALGDGQTGQRYIVTVAQRGYSLVAPVIQVAQDAPQHMRATPLRADHNLPLRRARMIGRQPLVDALVQTLHSQRLITLTGPGGIGKTSVALRVAEQLIGHYRDGIRLLELAPLSDPLLVPAQLAALFDLAPDDGDPLGQLCTWLRDKQVLLVIDNCEHLIDATALICERILRSAPQVAILTTSRERLRAEGEFIQRLESLDCPPRELDVELNAADFPALQLFVERAMSSQEQFEPNRVTLAMAGDICRRLDGIPLAIELAAAQVASLSLSDLQAQLQYNPAQLIHAGAHSTDRQQTLLATLDWSFHLLTPDEQCCLSRLSVFKSRFTLESALAVAGDASMPAATLYTAISQLVAKSLLNVEAGDEQVFYRLLDTTRHYALERLRQYGELPATLERHAEHCLALMQQARDDWEQLPTQQWLERYTRSLKDVREVLDWGLNGEGPKALAISLVAHSAPLWQELSRLKEHGVYVRKALLGLQHAGYQNPSLEMQLRLALGSFSYHSRGPTLETMDAFIDALRLAEQNDDSAGRLRAISGQMTVYLCRGDYPAALVQSRQFDRLGLGLDPEINLSAHRLRLLALHYEGRQPEARQQAENVLQRLAHNSQHNRFSRGFGIQYEQSVATLTVLARTLWLQGQPLQAERVARQALEIAVQIDHGLSICYTLALAGCPIALWSGNTTLAREQVTQLLAQTHKHGVLLFHTWGRHYARLLDLPNEAAGPATGLLSDILLTLRDSEIDPPQLERAQQGEAGWCSAEILRCRAENLLAPDDGQDVDEAEKLLCQALDIAREQGALAWALRSALSLARLRPEQTRALLVPLLERFEAGSQTPDMVMAQTLLSRA
ncbi:winged helix-turn-helix domain-containing protein [Pseudomonas sp. 3A(2025)]